MPTASLVLDAAYAIGPVPRRLFGTFVEHMGRCVYTGLYEPGHPRADGTGLREDMLTLTRELVPTVVRYPGGNFVSNYRWEDGVGPKMDRPTRLDLAWHSVETSQFGLHVRSEPGGDAWKQTIAYPFEQMRRLARGQILQLIAHSDPYDSSS